MRRILSSPFQLLIISPIFANQRLCRLLSGVMVVHLTLVNWGIPSWPCPIRHGLGIPCPGCGLSRSILHLCQGDWQKAVHIHAFSPIVLIFLILVVTIAVFPAKFQHFWVKKLEIWEKRTGFCLFLLLALLSYWLIRLFFFRATFYQLVL